MFADKKFEEAAALYVQIVDADPKGEDSDKALNNAAVAYENVKRFAAATRLYERIVSEYPTSKFVDDALFRTAVSYQKGFEFDKAVVSYQRLAEDKRFAASTHRTDSVYNAAVILENDQNYPKAAELFRRYAADKSVKRDDQAEAFYRMALIYEKMKQPDQTIKAMNEYVKTYGMDQKAGQRNLEAYFKIALAYESKRDRKAADDTYRKIVAMGATAAPASEPAEFAAHAAFILTEQKLPAIEKAKISGGGKKLGDSIALFKKNVTATVAEYNKILQYKRANWTLAAYFRTGYLFETFSKALLGAPCPPEVKKLGPEGCDLYREQIEQAVASVDEEAVKRYGVTLAASRQARRVERVDQAGAYAGQSVQAGSVPDGEGRANRDGAAVMRSKKIGLGLGLGLSLSLGLGSDLPSLTALAFAAEKLPEEKKGDPAPDTKVAKDLLGRGRYEDAIRQAKLALGRDERYVPAMVVMAKAYFYLKQVRALALHHRHRQVDRREQRRVLQPARLLSPAERRSHLGHGGLQEGHRSRRQLRSGLAQPQRAVSGREELRRGHRRR